MKKPLLAGAAGLLLAACSAAPDSTEPQSRASAALNPAVNQSCPALAGLAAAQLRVRFRDPLALMANGPATSTSRCTSMTNFTPCARHRIYEPQGGATRTPLFLFLPGSGMEPDKHDGILALA